MHYYTPDGRAVLDGAAGLWCCNAGHNRDADRRGDPGSRRRSSTSRRPSSSAIRKAFELASPHRRSSRRATSTTCSSATPARRRSTPRSRSRSPTRTPRARAARTRLIGRERGYHGVGFGGISVGGIVNNRKLFGSLLAGVDHLPHTYNRERTGLLARASRNGARISPTSSSAIVALHDASTIAAVIVEPMAGSTGVLPPPKGYLQRLREICDKHGILLIFDEVITGFGRLGTAFAAERYGVMPDMITFAKGVTSGTVPMGGVMVRKGIYDAFMNGPRARASSCSTATPIRPIRSPARRRSRRSTSTATRACSSAPRRSSPSGPTRACA